MTRLPLAWVVPGPLRQVTGGYLYDARMVDGLRERGWLVGVIDLRSTGWPLDLRAGRRLARALGRERWSAVVVDELAHPALTAALLAGRLTEARDGAALVLLVHHLRASEPGPRHTRLVGSLVERQVVRTADLVICTSATTAGSVRPWARRTTDVEVVRPGRDTHQVRPAPDREFALTPRPPVPHAEEREPSDRAPLCREAGEGASAAGGGRERGQPGTNGGLHVLMVGHWTPRKGIVEALRAMMLAPADVTLDLVGETDRDLAYASRVRTLLRESSLAGRVRVHGRVSSDDLARLYAGADVLLLTSSHEGYGMVLAEALSAGLPIVATRVGAVPEVVRDDQEAILVEPGDVRAVSRALEALARDPRERTRRAGLARERAASLPTWDASVAAFERALLRVGRH
jgi:glycosyltransferase involved in cell wall biosynthesis